MTEHLDTVPVQRGSLLMTVEQVAELWFGEVGPGGTASSNCQKVRRLIPENLPARRIGNRWYVHRAAAEAWAAESDLASRGAVVPGRGATGLVLDRRRDVGVRRASHR